MNILVVGTHRYRNQPSMFIFADWVVMALRHGAQVRLQSAPPIFFNHATRRWRGAKWFFYLDQFVVLPIVLGLASWRYDLIIVADHSNAFSTVLVPRRKLAAMVHDMIGVRQALGGIPGAPAAGASGRLLQKMVLLGLKRARRLAVSADKVARELARFGVVAPALSVGCTLDLDRLGESSEPARLSARLAGRPFVLNVATDDWRKRKPFLVETWDRLCSSHRAAPILLLVGYTSPETTELAERAGGAVIVAAESSDAELVWLYQNCVATIAASSEEGFCIPILESLYFKKPVLGVRDAAYVEIFGDAILPFDIDRPEHAAEVIYALLSEDQPKRRGLARRDELVGHFSFAEFSRRLAAAFGLVETDDAQRSTPNRFALRQSAAASS